MKKAAEITPNPNTRSWTLPENWCFTREIKSRFYQILPKRRREHQGISRSINILKREKKRIQYVPKMKGTSLLQIFKCGTNIEKMLPESWLQKESAQKGRCNVEECADSYPCDSEHWSPANKHNCWNRLRFWGHVTRSGGYINGFERNLTRDYVQ